MKETLPDGVESQALVLKTTALLREPRIPDVRLPQAAFMRADGTIVGYADDDATDAAILLQAFTLRATHFERDTDYLPRREPNGFQQLTKAATTMRVLSAVQAHPDHPLATAQSFADVYAEDDGVEHAYLVGCANGRCFAVDTGAGRVDMCMPDWTRALAVAPPSEWDWIIQLHTHPGGTKPSQGDKYQAFMVERELEQVGYKGMSAYATVNTVTGLLEPYEPEEPPNGGNPILAILAGLTQAMLDSLKGEKGEPGDEPGDGEPEPGEPGDGEGEGEGEGEGDPQDGDGDETGDGTPDESWEPPKDGNPSKGGFSF